MQMADVTVKINGNVINFPEQQPEIIENRVMVPLRTVFEALGYHVDWNGAVVVENSQYKLTFIIGEKTYLIQKWKISRPEYRTLYVAPYINPDTNRTMIPLRDPLEAVGCTVDWDDEQRIVSIEPPYFNVLSKMHGDLPGTSTFYDEAQKAFPFKGTLAYTNSGDQAFIFCNFPETIRENASVGFNPGDHAGALSKEDCLADNGYYLNRATVTKRKFLIYASYVMEYPNSGNYQFGVYVRNNGGTPVRLTNTNCGYQNQPYNSWDIAKDAYRQYKNNKPNKDYDIQCNEFKQILYGSFDRQSFLEVLSHYEADTDNPNLEVTVYIATDLNSKVNGNETHLPYTHNAFTVALGDKYRISTSMTYNVSDMNNLPDRSYYHIVAASSMSENPGEAVTFIKSQPPHDVITDANSEFGQYAVEYDFKKTFVNDTESPIVIKGYLIASENNTNNASHCAGITSSDSVGTKLFSWSTDASTDGKKMPRWEFFNLPLAPGKSRTIDYQYMMLSKGSKCAILQYRAVNQGESGAYY